MKIAVPCDGKRGLNEKIAEHFGRCLYYTIIDEDGEIIEIINNTSEHMGGQGLPPELLKKNKVNVLLCNGIGPRAIEMCKQLDIEVFVCEGETIKEVFDFWKNNKLNVASEEDSCGVH